MKSNRKIDQLILTCEWAMDKQFAIQTMQKYLIELDFINSGGKYSALGMSGAREEQQTAIIDPDGRMRRLSIRDEEVPIGSIAYLKLKGVMMANDGLSTRGIDSLARDIYEANSIDNIDAILIEANTGGGELTAGVMLKNAIADSQKPVIVYGYRLASAGILGTLDANEIIAASDYSPFGSIGVYISINDEYATWYKENITDIYSEKSPDKNKNWRQYLEGDITSFLTSVTKTDDIFMSDVVSSGRLKGDEDMIAETLAGGMFQGEDAKMRGLIDGIGTFKYAIVRTKAHIQATKRIKLF